MTDAAMHLEDIKEQQNASQCPSDGRLLYERRQHFVTKCENFPYYATGVDSNDTIKFADYEKPWFGTRI